MAGNGREFGGAGQLRHSSASWNLIALKNKGDPMMGPLSAVERTARPSFRWDDAKRRCLTAPDQAGGVGSIDALLRARIRQSAKAPIRPQTTLSEAEGSAPCHQPLTTKPAAPNTFMPW